MESQVIIKPTFLLRSIDPLLLIEEYTKGSVLSTLAFDKKRIAPVTLTSNRGKSFRDGIYMFRNHDNFIHTIATAGGKDFSFVDGNRQPRKGGTCVNCKREFTDEALGVPVRLSQDGNTILVYCLYTTCNFRCTLNLIRTLRRYRRSINLVHAEEFLHFVYRKMHPDGPSLHPSLDPLLLSSNGGSLTDEEFDDSRYTYVHVPNLIIYPAKEQYLRISK